MSMLGINDDALTVLTPLTTQRTIARHLVHRAALAEVFLADFQSVDEDTFRGSAQLPPDHSYYGDHTGRPLLHDPLAVFEAVRQTLLCAMHLQHDAGGDTKAITATMGMDLHDVRPLRHTGGPLDLDLSGRVLLVKEYAGAVSRVIHEVDVAAGGRTVGTVTVDTALRPDSVYQGLRMSNRTGQPPYSDSLPTGIPADAVAPGLVGRADPRNVVLRAPRDTGEAFTAVLRVPGHHASMFDHPQDHVPGPVLMEAARQLALLLAGERHGLTPVKLYLEHVRATYLRFAELDSDITVEARPAAEQDRNHPGELLDVDFRQDGESVARMTVRLGSTLGRDLGDTDRITGGRDAL